MQGRLSHYRLEGLLGQGGMGLVYRAIDTRLGRKVAIKVLPPVDRDDPERYARFVREAQAASALNHPHIVTIYDIGEDDGRTFIAMELVEGQPLKDLLAAGPLPIAEAIRLAEQVAGALATAHGAGIVHRDIKPANIVVSTDGRAKVLDFGLAKIAARADTDPTMTGMTRPGTVLGTLAYMSPEQAEGRTADARSDVFSLGCVLYEMLAGRRPFTAASDGGLVSAILRDEPPPIRTVRTDVPSGLVDILKRALAKDPAGRYRDAGGLRDDLAGVLESMRRPSGARWRRPAVLVPVVVALVAAAALGGWQTVQARRVEAVRQREIPEIQRLQFSDESLRAVQMAARAERIAPAEITRLREAWFPSEVVTDPPDAAVEIKNYMDLDGPWEPFGRTPVVDRRLPQGLYRMRITKAGYAPLELSYAAGMPPLTLTPEATAEPGMVRVPGGPFGVGVAAPVELPDFWMDRFEVTNRDYKRFVDAGGYKSPVYWRIPFRDGDRSVPFEAAMARFRDSTDRLGPATWVAGTYADGQADHPVGGISWYEAHAYAAFAGKQVPTIYHWYRASGMDLPYSDMLRLAQFDSRGPAGVGERQGIGPFGTFDMAGNVKEWCVNAAGDTGRHYILGGGWNESAYRFRESDAQDPWRREPMYGVRLIKSPEVPAAAASVPHVEGDPDSLVPVSDAAYEILRAFYSYDRTPLDARVESRDDSSPDWIKQRVSFTAAYEGERIPAFLFLPKNARPPYQTVVLFPSSYAREVASSELLDYSSFDFIIRSGRALLYPVYFGTYERNRREPAGTGYARDRNVKWAKDVFRAIDYLESRNDIDVDRLGYFSISLGAYFGPIPVALDDRIKAAVFVAGGLRFTPQPEIQTANFMPRVKVPVLLVNGRDDFAVPPAYRQRFLELLGTPPDRKRLVALDGGHLPSDMRGFYRETLSWFDAHLGPVR